MGHVAAGALVTTKMFKGLYLFEPQGPRWAGLMTAQAIVVGELHLGCLDIWIVGMRAAKSVAGFTRKGLVLIFGHLLEDFRVAFIAGFHAGKNRLGCGEFLQCGSAEPAIFAE